MTPSGTDQLFRSNCRGRRNYAENGWTEPDIKRQAETVRASGPPWRCLSSVCSHSEKKKFGNFVAHLLTHIPKEDYSTFNCYICGTNFTLEGGLTRHNASKHSGVSTPASPMIQFSLAPGVSPTPSSSSPPVPFDYQGWSTCGSLVSASLYGGQESHSPAKPPPRHPQAQLISSNSNSNFLQVPSFPTDNDPSHLPIGSLDAPGYMDGSAPAPVPTQEFALTWDPDQIGEGAFDGIMVDGIIWQCVDPDVERIIIRDLSLYHYPATDT